MAAEPTEPSDDLLDVVGTDRSEEDFWTEADQGRSRRHRPPKRAPHEEAPTAGRSLRHRISAAWAAEMSAMRALRTHPTTGTAPDEPTKPPERRRRKAVVAIVSTAAVLALLLAVADITLRVDDSSDRAAASDEATGAGARPGEPESDGSSSGTSGDGAGADDVRTTVASQIVDAPASRKPGAATSSVSKPSTTTPKAPVAGTTPSGATQGPNPSGSPVTAPPATAVPTTAAPQPNAPTTAPPTTAAPRPPAAPRVDAFTAVAATRPGGACGATQWATTLTWRTSDAKTLTITGLLEPTLSQLPGDGSKVVCRILPGGPLGGWTLTASGPGGTTTAKA